MFETLPSAPPDAIIAMIAKSAADTNPDKIDLGVGIYQDKAGATPVMRAVKTAEQRLLASEDTKKYVGILGAQDYCSALSELLLGQDNPLRASGRIAMAQAAGGSGALRLGAEIIKLAHPGAVIWVSTPTWANHVPLLGAAGLTLRSYPYYNPETQSIDFDAMCDHLRAHAKPGDVVVLHGCCHNPTGADLSPAQWDAVCQLVLKKNMLPFVDIAYLGMGGGLDADTYGLRAIAAACPEAVIAASCSKNFGLYRERTGLVMIIAADAHAADLARGQLSITMRRMISMPPNHGAAIVTEILTDAELRTDWQAELEEMRTRMIHLRTGLANALRVQGREQMAGAIAAQSGMFSLLPVTPAQAETLRNEHSVYLLNSGRINVAGIAEARIDALAHSILSVL